MHPTVNASRGLPGTCSLRVAQNARVPILGAEASQGSQRFTFRCGQKVQMSCLFSQLFPATRRPVFIMEFGVWSMECGVWSMHDVHLYEDPSSSCTSIVRLSACVNHANKCTLSRTGNRLRADLYLYLLEERSRIRESDSCPSPNVCPSLWTTGLDGLAPPGDWMPLLAINLLGNAPSTTLPRVVAVLGSATRFQIAGGT